MVESYQSDEEQGKDCANVFYSLKEQWKYMIINLNTLAILFPLRFQFMREHEQDLVFAQRIRIMMTQIQPHFLFNALNTIRALCKKDPTLVKHLINS